MFLTVHAAVGALIGQEINSSFLAFIFSFISHFILDLIPHGDDNFIKNYRNGDKIKIMLSIILLDITATIVFILTFLNVNLANPQLKYIFWGILGSILPDFLVGLYELFEIKILRRFHHMHYRIHSSFKKFQINFLPGLAVQIIFLVLIISSI